MSSPDDAPSLDRVLNAFRSSMSRVASRADFTPSNDAPSVQYEIGALRVELAAHVVELRDDGVDLGFEGDGRPASRFTFEVVPAAVDANPIEVSVSTAWALDGEKLRLTVVAFNVASEGHTVSVWRDDMLDSAPLTQAVTDAAGKAELTIGLASLRDGSSLTALTVAIPSLSYASSQSLLILA